MCESNELEVMIIDILKKRPASAETISFITGRPINSVLMKLNKMENWKNVKRLTKKKMIIWGLAPD